MPIHVLSRDGQSISGSQDTLTGGGGGQCTCAHPCTVPGWSEYLGISGYSDRGGQCTCAHPCTVLGWSDYLRISGSRDSLTGRGGGAVYTCPSMYCPGMVRVSWDLGIL